MADAGTPERIEYARPRRYPNAHCGRGGRSRRVMWAPVRRCDGPAITTATRGKRRTKDHHSTVERLRCQTCAARV